MLFQKKESVKTQLTVHQKQIPNSNVPSGTAVIPDVTHLDIKDGFLYGYNSQGKVIAIVPANEVAICNVENIK